MFSPNFRVMSSMYCSQGHVNPTDSRFCRLCGERLIAQSPKVDPLVMVGAPAVTTVGLRYRIRCQLGCGGFGRTYLAEDVHRFDEPCVLKEFAPQVEGPEALRKAEKLFEREAGVLYRLSHPQIPKFRELLRADFEGRERLFLVQDYIEGQTYDDLLNARQRQGTGFSEAEVLDLLLKLLPVLQYIHSAGVIHRDISPDNLILRESDQVPVLIDFGGVKQAAYVAASEFAHPQQAAPETIVTLLGKRGFAPDEQIQSGQAYPHSDLYALAVTAIVLLTGQSPHRLFNDTVPGSWQQQAQISQGLKYVLNKMLARNPGDRYPSARDVLQTLSALPKPAHPAAPNPLPGAPAVPLLSPAQPTATVAVGRPLPVSTTAPVQAETPGPAARRRSFDWGQLLRAIALVMGVAGIGWWVGYQWLSDWLIPDSSPSTEETSSGETEESGESTPLPPEEQARKDDLNARRDRLGVNDAFLVSLTDASFYEQYPEQTGRSLTNAAEDAEWRSRWDAIAATWLDVIEAHLSDAARQSLGNYGEGDRDRWKEAVVPLNISRRALYDLADAKFFHLFPDQQEAEFLDRPIGQIWHGIADDELSELQSGQHLTPMRFPEGAVGDRVEGTLQPGGGHVYVLGLAEGQSFELNLDAPADSALVSLYVPSPTDELPYLIADSRDQSWSGELPQTGFYEVVVVSTASEPMNYDLEVSAN